MLLQLIEFHQRGPACDHSGMETKEPQTPAELMNLLQELRLERERRKTEQKRRGHKRKKLPERYRPQVLAKTDGRCHICGGEIERPGWHVDHVLAHSGGGLPTVDNCLPAHQVCNIYRWDRLPEETQLVLKLGVFVREAIEKNKLLGREVADAFMKKEERRRSRRVSKT